MCGAFMECVMGLLGVGRHVLKWKMCDRAQNQLERLEALPEVTEAWPSEASNVGNASQGSDQVLLATFPSPSHYYYHGVLTT